MQVTGDADVVEDAQATEEPDILKRARNTQRDDFVDAQTGEGRAVERDDSCLLYTSDAADEMD
jgi:hypothetical protein